MRNIKRIALLLSLVLLASMTGCARKSRRPALPSAPLQASLTAESADTGETASTDEMAPMMKSAAVSASRAVVMEEPVETLLEQFAEPLENEDALYQGLRAGAPFGLCEAAAAAGGGYSADSAGAAV